MWLRRIERTCHPGRRAATIREPGPRVLPPWVPALGLTPEAGMTPLLHECLLASLSHSGQDNSNHRQRRQRQHRRTDRTLQKYHRIAARERHGAAQVFLHHRPEYVAEQQRRRLAVELGEDVAEHG